MYRTLDSLTRLVLGRSKIRDRCRMRPETVETPPLSFRQSKMISQKPHQHYVASRVCNVDCQYLSKLCPPSPPRRVMCIDDGRRLSSLRKGWYLLLGDLVPCVFISSSIDQLRLDWTRSVLSGPRFSLPVTALPSSCSGAKAVRACH